MGKEMYENLRGKGKKKKSTWDLWHLNSHLMVLKGIDSQKEQAQKGIKEKKRLNSHRHILYFHLFLFSVSEISSFIYSSASLFLRHC